MRLIDADKLKNKLQARHDNGNEDFDKGYNVGLGTAIDLIDNAPTECEAYRSFCVAKQRPHGKWVLCEDTYFSKCSICGDIWLNEECGNYCSNCGADMREDSDE